MFKHILFVVTMLISLGSFNVHADSVLPEAAMPYSNSEWQVNDFKATPFPEHGMKVAFDNAFSKWQQCSRIEYRWYLDNQEGYAICDAKGKLPTYNPEMIMSLRTWNKDADMKYVQIAEYRWVFPYSMNRNGEADINAPIYQVIWKDGTEFVDRGDYTRDVPLVLGKIAKNKMLDGDMKSAAPQAYYQYMKEMYEAAKTK